MEKLTVMRQSLSKVEPAHNGQDGRCQHVNIGRNGYGCEKGPGHENVAVHCERQRLISRLPCTQGLGERQLTRTEEQHGRNDQQKYGYADEQPELNFALLAHAYPAKDQPRKFELQQDV